MSTTIPLLRLAAMIALAVTLPSQAGAFSVLSHAVKPAEFSQWQGMAGDSLVIDTKENIGYLRHENGEFTEFRTVSGQNRTVRYIGRLYNAKTPERSWTALSLEKKGDHVTFGKTGRFLRLTNNANGEKTPYGIHSHISADTMLADDDRFRSMGCIVVSESVLDLIIASFAANDGQLRVVTMYGSQQISKNE